MRHTALAASLALAGAIAAPVAAQGVSCGGVGDGAPWLGQTRAASDIATADAALSASGVQVQPGGRSAALFTLSAPMAVRVEAAPTSPAGDTLVELFDADGRLVVIDDDSGGGLSSRAEPELAPGDYCVAVAGFAGSGVTADVQVSRLGMDSLTPGLSGGFAGTEGRPPFVGVEPCLPETAATPLGQEAVDAQLAQGLRAVNSVAAVPYYRFTLDSPQPVVIDARNPAADPYIYLFDGQGTLLAENDDDDGLDSRIEMTRPLPAGDYCIAMRALSDPGLPVTLALSAPGTQAAASADYAAGEVAPPLDGSWPVERLGRLPPRLTREWQVPGGQAQWFSMEVPRAGLVVITADEVRDSDPVIALFDASGQRVGMNDDANGTLNSQMAVSVEPGRYRLAVRQYAPRYQGVIRIGIARYVPAPR